MTPLVPICDSHAHLFYPELDAQLDAVLARAVEAGVSIIVNVATDPPSNAVVVAQTRRANTIAGGPRVYTSLGFHPHNAHQVTPQDWDLLARLTDEPEVVALGEFGLDYHYDLSPRPEQREVFRRGIRLALEKNLPLVVHTRDAAQDTIAILDEEARGSMPRGVFHCFTDTWELASAALERGFYIGLTGIVTYANSENVREVARRIPLDRLLVETDAPYCTPEPVRTARRQARKKGKDEPNEPALVAYVCDALADLYSIDLNEVRRRTFANARELYRLP
jgi:TatD DNase family protein